MPNVKDAPVIVTGQVIDNQIKTKRDTGEYVGRKVMVMASGEGDPGFAVVNFDAEEGAIYNPDLYSIVSWVVRSAPYDIKDGPSGMSTKFLREVSENDLDRLVSAVNSKATASK